MNRGILTTSLVLIGWLAMQAAPAAAQNHVVNGSFEDGKLTQGTGNNVHLMSLPPGATTILNWTVEGAELAWAETGNHYVNPASNGNRFLDLTGFHDSRPYGAVRQTINGLRPSLTYELSLDLGTDQAQSAYSGPIAVDVMVENGTTITKTCASNPPPNSGVVWERCAFRFVAQAPDATIHITGKTGKQYIGIDNVSVTYVSPIPRWVNQFVLPAVIVVLALFVLLVFVLFVQRSSAHGA